MRAPGNRQRGFTLVEVLFVIMIVGVLLGVGVPSLTSYIRATRVKTASYDFYAALLFARSEAMKRRANVKVIPLTGTGCTTWGCGWQVQLVSDSSVLRRQDPPTGVTITHAGAVVPKIEFRADGRQTVNYINVLIRPSPADSSIQNRCIRIDVSGLARAYISSATAATAC